MVQRFHVHVNWRGKFINILRYLHRCSASPCSTEILQIRLVFFQIIYLKGHQTSCCHTFKLAACPAFHRLSFKSSFCYYFSLPEHDFSGWKCNSLESVEALPLIGGRFYQLQLFPRQAKRLHVNREVKMVGCSLPNFYPVAENRIIQINAKLLEFLYS